MAIRQSDLRAAARTITAGISLENLKARARRGFLCHSHKDRELAQGLQTKLMQQGVDLYIDWMDTEMPAVPDKTTAQRIQEKITQADIFLFLATESSLTSRWCPWEIGYADGKKLNEKIAVIPTSDDRGTSYGNEYLQLYRRFDYSTGGAVAWFDKNATVARDLRYF